MPVIWRSSAISDLKSRIQYQAAGRPTEYAILKEQQSTLLLTYMRNNNESKWLIYQFFH